MDETVVLFGDCRTQTIDLEGRKHVIVESTGFYFMHIKACISVWGYGRKDVRLIIHKGKESCAITRKTGPLLKTTQAKSWVKSKLLIKLINDIFPVVYVSVGSWET